MVGRPDGLRAFFEQPRQTAARRWLFQVHLYLGLILGIYVAVVSVSGSALVFRPEMERHFAYGQLSLEEGVTARPFQAAWTNLRRTYPGSAFPSMSRSQYPLPGPTDPYRVKVQTGSQYTFAYVDHWTGEIVGSQHPALDWLQNLHFDLLGGSTGLILNTVGAVLLVVMCLSGAAVWWPGRRDWKRGFAVAWRARWQSVNYDLHGAVGATTVAFVAAVAIGGVWLGYRDFSRYQPDEVSWQARVPSWPVDLDVVVDRAEAAVADGTLIGLFLPQNSTAPFRVDKKSGQGVASVFVDQRTGQVIRVNTVPDTSARARIDQWLAAIHYGRFGGYATRALWVVLGVVPSVLLVTGMLMWWNRVLVKKLRPRRGDSPTRAGERVSSSAWNDRGVA